MSNAPSSGAGDPPAAQLFENLRAAMRDDEKAGKRALARVLFGLAESYNQISLLSFEKITATNDANFGAPAVMCCAFSIELLFKSYLASRQPTISSTTELSKLGIKLNGHKYSVLFDRLLPKQQNSLAENFSKIVGKQVDALGFKLALIEVGDEPFVIWRYVYESDGTRVLNLELLRQITDAMGRTVLAEVSKIPPRLPK